MKLLLIFLGIISWIGAGICTIWSLVEFILYLVKDKPFDWWSLYSIIICLLGGMMLFISSVFGFDDNKKHSIRKSSTATEAVAGKANLPEKTIIKKSKFQQRLEEMAIERNKNKKII